MAPNESMRSMNSSRRVPLIVVSIVLATVCSACQIARAADDAARPVTRVWRAEEGLSHDHITAIVQTGDSYLWMVNYLGQLVRFDGVRFVSMGREDANFAPMYADGDEARVLRAGRDGALWVGTLRGAVWRVRDGRPSPCLPARGRASDEVKSLLETRDRSILVGTAAGLRRVRFEAGALAEADADVFLPEAEIRALAEDENENGAVWIGTASHGLYRRHRGGLDHFTNADGLASNGVWSILSLPGGDVWVGTEDGLCQRKGDQFKPHDRVGAFGHSWVYAIRRDSVGDLWLASPDGLFRIRASSSGKVGELERATPRLTLDVVVDREKSAWAATSTGLVRFRRPQVEVFAPPADPSVPAPATVCEARGGGLWVGTDKGVYHLADGRFSIAKQVALLPRFATNGLFEDADGTIWVGTWNDGLYHCRPGQVDRFTKADGLGDDTIRSIYRDRAGDLWLGTWGGGLSRMRGDRIDTFTTRDGLAHNRVRALHQDRRGALWIATHGGLNRWDGVRFTTYTMGDGLAGNSVMSLYEDDRGNMWIGTMNGGLSRIEGGGRITSFTAKDGLGRCVITQILGDDQGQLWLGTASGILRIAIKDLDAYIRAGRPSRGLPLSYIGKEDGMLAGQCNGGSAPSGCRDRDGALWFPTIAGLVRIDPKAAEVEMPPPVVIESILADGRPVPLTGSISLPAGRGDLEFRFTANSFINSDRVRFEYQLEGYDRGWTHGGSRREAFYTNIPPGRYCFRVRACNRDGVWTDHGADIHISIAPHFYQTRSFLAACILAGLLASRAAHRLRIKQLHARQCELARMVESRTADLREAHASLEERNGQLEELATTDALTGLKNRRAFNEALETAALLASRQGFPLSIVLLDVDHFKSYNDSFGHLAGDEVLREIGRLLLGGVRAHDVAARYGGEEFVVLLPFAEADEARVFSERIWIAIGSHRWPMRPVTASLGVATDAGGICGAAELLERADRALYESKRVGRDRVTHDDDLRLAVSLEESRA
jgi:diguanylate cyclase (GGDEF)-like protein